jgi:hypothetical protein
LVSVFLRTDAHDVDQAIRLLERSFSLAQAHRAAAAEHHSGQGFD